MSSSLLLVLIIVVWVFVLAPLVVNKREPIRRTSEGLGRTRLLHRGGDELTVSRRPRFTGDDVRRRDDGDEDLLETVDAEPDGIDGLLIDDDPGRGDRAASREGAADAEVPGDVVEGDVVYELEAAREGDSAGDPAGAPADGAGPDATAAGDVAEESAAPGEDAEPGGDDAADGDGADRPAAAVPVAGGDAEPDAAAGADDGLDAHVAAADFLAARDRRTAAEKMADRAAAAEAADVAATAETGDAEDAGDGGADAVAAGEAAADGPVDSADRDLHVVADEELTEDDYAWAAAHRGRGGYDPVAAARYAETRFARRRRTVHGLLAAIAVTLVLGVVLGGGWWAAPAAVVALTVAYLVTLRRTVVAEQELRARRIASLKRRRMGVRSREAEELGIPQRLRRPGAIVVELDDEDPDFADVPLAGDGGGHDDWDGRRASGM